MTFIQDLHKIRLKGRNMNLFKLYDKYLISILEKEIKQLKYKKADEKLIDELRNILLKYYISYIIWKYNRLFIW